MRSTLSFSLVLFLFAAASPAQDSRATLNGRVVDPQNVAIPSAEVVVTAVNNVDAGVYKNFKVQERVKVQFRFELFNAFNHVRFPAPNADATSGSFGRVTKTQQNNPRQVQMALKLSF